VDVRISWTVLVWPLIWAMVFTKAGLEMGPAFGWGAAFTLVLFASVYTHEMGHIWMGRRYGVPTERMTLRALGGLAHMESGAPHPRAEVAIALAGPVTHLPWLLLFYGAQVALEASDGAPLTAAMLGSLTGLQVFLGGFNLLPFYPLDGGRVLRGLLAERMHPNRASLFTANVGYGGAVAIGLVGLTTWFGEVGWLGAGNWGFFLVWIGVENFFACRRLTVEARWGEGPYEQQEAWKRGGYEDPYGASLAEHERVMREAEKEDQAEADARRKERARREDLQRRVDELLDRINEVGGLDNLSAAERRELTEASELLRQGA